MAAVDPAIGVDHARAEATARGESWQLMAASDREAAGPRQVSAAVNPAGGAGFPRPERAGGSRPRTPAAGRQPFRTGAGA